MSSARIAHYCDGRNQFERVDSLDGQMRRVFRHNNVVHTLWPQAKLAMVEQRELMSSFPALLQGGDDRIVDSYEVQSLGTDRVAGHEAHVLHVKPDDAHRFGHRLWAEKVSGLLLRAEVSSERDEVIESSAFSDVMIGVRAQPESVLQPMSRLDGYRVLRPVLTPDPSRRRRVERARPVTGVSPGQLRQEATGSQASRQVTRRSPKSCSPSTRTG